MSEKQSLQAEINNRKFPIGFEESFLIERIRKWYHVQVISLHRLPSDSGKYIYQVNLADEVHWILRMGEGQSKTTLVDLTDLLTFFEQQNYPAERVILTVEQTAIVTVNTWQLLMTTFLVGTPLEYTPAALSLVGASVGQLHALRPALPMYLPKQVCCH